MAKRDILAERGLRIPTMPASGDDESGPSIEEVVLASDEPLRVLALPDAIGQYGVFLGEQMIWSSSEPVDAHDMATDFAEAVEKWREAVRLQRAADEA